jgi:hypothetical protein
LLWKKLLDNNADWFGPLSMSSTSLTGGLRQAHVNFMSLASRIAGSKRVKSTRYGTPAKSTDIVQSVATYNAQTNTAYVLVFNHNPVPGTTTAEPVALTLKKIQPASGTGVNVTRWTLDDTHGNYWKTWLWSAGQCHVPDSAYKWSKHSSEVPVNISEDWLYCWEYFKPGITSASQMTPVVTNNVSTPGNSLSLSTTLADHGVTLYEISNAALVP